MKILYYNWVQFDDPEKRGGGVSVYLRNLIGQLVKQKLDVYFLCSGLSYNFFKNDTYIRRTKNIFGNNCRTFEIVNSRVMSPGHFSFHTIKDAIENREMTEVFYEFLKENGPFDVIHFHNLEGISTTTFHFVHKSISGAGKNKIAEIILMEPGASTASPMNRHIKLPLGRTS